MLGTLYMYPMAIHGPAEQAIGLLEVLTVASLLNFTVILPPVHNAIDHLKDKLDFWEYYQLYDLSLVSGHVNTVPFQEVARREFWNGAFDKLVCFGSTCKHTDDFWATYQEHAMTFNVAQGHLPANFTISKLGILEDCDEADLKSFQKYMLGPQKFIALASQLNMFQMSKGQATNACSARFQLLNALLRPNATLVDITHDIIEDDLDSGSYIAADFACPEEDVVPGSPETTWKVCSKALDLKVVKGALVKQASEANVTMVHISVTPREVADLVIQSLSPAATAAGELEFHKLDSKKLEKRASGLTGLKLSVMDYELCLRARMFLGNWGSPRTQRVYYSRMQNGVQSRMFGLFTDANKSRNGGGADEFRRSFRKTLRHPSQ